MVSNMFVLQNVTKYFPTLEQTTEKLFPYISIHTFLSVHKIQDLMVAIMILIQRAINTTVFRKMTT
jgi:hypothetical protein